MEAGSRIAVVGSRDFRYLQMVAGFVKTMPQDLVLVSGGATGVDRMAELTARELGMKVKIYPVSKEDWKKHGKRAGLLRNDLILENCEAVIAFWDGKSKGTGYTLLKAKEMLKPTRIFNGAKNAEWRDDLFAS